VRSYRTGQYDVLDHTDILCTTDDAWPSHAHTATVLHAITTPGCWTRAWGMDGFLMEDNAHAHPMPIPIPIPIPYKLPFPNPLRGILRLGPSILALHHRQSRHVDQHSPSGGDSTAPGERAVMARSARDAGRHDAWRDDNSLLHRGPISCHDVTMGGFSKHGKQEKPAKFTLPSIAGPGFSGGDGKERYCKAVAVFPCSNAPMLQCSTRYGSAPVLQSSQLLQCSNGPKVPVVPSVPAPAHGPHVACPRLGPAPKRPEEATGKDLPPLVTGNHMTPCLALPMGKLDGAGWASARDG
jgi:hypothetical protein